MKNKYVFLCLILMCTFVTKQSFGQPNPTNATKRQNSSPVAPKRLSLVAGVGLASTFQYGGVWLQKSAPVLFIEPQYSLTKKLTIGLRGEYALLKMYKATYNTTTAASNFDNSRIKAPTMPSLGLFLEYHFQNDAHRYIPLIGLGIHNFFRGKGELISLANSPTVNLGSSSGLSPRFGMVSKRWIYMGEANILWENKTHGRMRSWWGNSGEYRGRSYLTLKVGYRF